MGVRKYFGLFRRDYTDWDVRNAEPCLTLRAIVAAHQTNASLCILSADTASGGV